MGREDEELGKAMRRWGEVMRRWGWGDGARR